MPYGEVACTCIPLAAKRISWKPAVWNIDESQGSRGARQHYFHLYSARSAVEMRRIDDGTNHFGRIAVSNRNGRRGFISVTLRKRVALGRPLRDARSRRRAIAEALRSTKSPDAGIARKYFRTRWRLRLTRGARCRERRSESRK